MCANVVSSWMHSTLSSTKTINYILQWKFYIVKIKNSTDCGFISLRFSWIRLNGVEWGGFEGLVMDTDVHLLCIHSDKKFAGCPGWYSNGRGGWIFYASKFFRRSVWPAGNAFQAQEAWTIKIVWCFRSHSQNPLLQHLTTRVVFEWAAWCGIYIAKGRVALVARYYLSSWGIDWFHLFRCLSRSSHHVVTLVYNELRFQVY